MQRRLSTAADAVGKFFGVGENGAEVIEQWQESAEKKIKDGTYGIHMSQTNVLQGKSSKEKIVKSADKVLKTISKSLMIDQQEEEAGEEEEEKEEEGEQKISTAEEIELSDLKGKDEAEAAGGSEVAEAKAVGFAGIDEITDADLEKIEVKQEAGSAEDDLIYGKAAFKHYKFYTLGEGKRKIEGLKEELADKLAEYDWKLKAIDEMVHLARAYYNNPHSEQGGQWQNLKKLVRQNSRRSLTRQKSLGKVSETVIRHELSKLPIFKPFFTLFIIAVQIITFIFLVSFGGITYIGVEPKLILTGDITTYIGTETVNKWTPPNIWIGPDQRFFIGIGAVYAPCMREDFSVQHEYSMRNYSMKDPLGCCEIASRNVAGTMTEHECAQRTEGFGKWHDGTMCGQRVSPNNSVAHNMKPCCVDLKGTCDMISHEHCVFLNGIFHAQGPEHCSQVNCLEGICKMGSLPATSEQPWTPVQPNQWWRLILSLIYHHGFLHIAMVTVIQWLVMRQIEKTAGWFRMLLIYLISGIGGLLTSSLFEPDVTAVGGVQPVFGMFGVLLIELTQFWPIINRPWLELLKIVLVIIAFLLLGTLPYLDNFGMLVGLCLGMLSAIIVLPYITFRRWQVKARLVLVAVAVPSLFLVLFGLFYSFYHVQTAQACSACRWINCIPYTETMCDSSLWS